MANDTEQLEVVVTLRDEASATADKVRAALKRLNADSKETEKTTREGLKSLTSVAENLGREIGTTARMLGIQGAFVSGGFVAAIAAMTVAVGNFARSSLTLRYTAQEVNLTYAEFTKFSNAIRTKGLSEEEAGGSTKKFAEALLNLRRGTESTTRHRLEGSLGSSGMVFARRAEIELNEQGLPKLMRRVASDLARLSHGTADEKWAAKEIMAALGINQATVDGINQNYDRLTASVEPGKEATEDFMKAMVGLEVAVENFKNKVGIVLMPQLEKLLEWLSDWLRGDRGKAFVQRIKGWITSLGEMDWDSIRQTITQALAGIGTEIKNFVKDIAAAITALDAIIKTVDKWKTGNEEARARGEQPATTLFGGGAPQKFSDDIWDQRPGILPDQNGFQAYKFNPDPNFLSGSPLSNNVEDRRDGGGRGEPFSEKVEKRRSKTKLRDQTKFMATEVQRLVDTFRDIRGGAGGGSSDGGVSRRNRSPSSGVGGSGGAPRMPDDRIHSFPSDELLGGAIAAANPYGSFAGIAGMGSFARSMIRSNWPLGLMRQGSQQQEPGVYPRQLNSFEQSMGDTFPSLERKHRGATGTWPSLGDANNTLQDAELDDVGKGMGWMNFLAGDAQRSSVDGALNGWGGGREGSGATGSLNLDVNVRGPRGTKVDADVTDGDFIPADRGITINREMRE